MADVSADLAIALGRARKQTAISVIVASLLTGALVGWRAIHPARFDASIVVRVTERQFDEDTQPPSSGELSQRIHETFLSRSTLLGMIEDMDLYPDAVGPDPSLALVAFRDDLDVRVVQNYFDPERYVAVPVRSARIIIEYSGRTSELAVAVVRAIGEQISVQQSERRRLAANAASLRATMTQQALHAQLAALAKRQAELNIQKETSLFAAVQLSRFTESSRALEAELDAVNRASARYDLRGELEDHRLAIQFDLIDGAQRPTPLLGERETLMLIGALGFIVFLPLTGLAFGAFSATVAEPYSISRLGLRCLGRLEAPARGRGDST